MIRIFLFYKLTCIFFIFCNTFNNIRKCNMFSFETTDIYYVLNLVASQKRFPVFPVQAAKISVIRFFV